MYTSMRRIIVISLLCVFVGMCLVIILNVFVKGQPVALIHIHIRDPSQKEIIVLLPVKGANFWANKKVISLYGQNTCTISVPKEDCGLILIRSDFFVTRIIAFPGDNINLNINPPINAKSNIEYKGDNAEGHRLFNSLDRELIADVENSYEQDTSASIIEKKINAKREKELTELSRLSKDGSISKLYADFAKLDILYYYAGSLADAMFIKYYFANLAKERKERDSIVKQEFITEWERSFKVMPLDLPEAIKSEYFQYYARIYYEWLHYIGNKKTAAQGHLSNYRLINERFKGKIREYLIAKYIYYYVVQAGRYEQSLVDIYEKFTWQYPQSDYIPFLKDKVDRIMVYQRTKEKDFTLDQKFLSEYKNINSVNELLNALKGSAYYVDIWATWCSPCKEEFRYNPALLFLLKSQKIKMLYISIDKDEADDDWKNMIKYYNLSGIHLRASEQLSKDLNHNLGKNDIFGIPRYLLVDKNGKIVNDNAERPSDTGKLRSQIYRHSFFESVPDNKVP